MDFNERVIPNVSANFLYQEGVARYLFAKRFLKKGMRILDLGCGTGYGANILAEVGSVVGVDKDPEAINYAKKKFGKKAKFMVRDVYELGINGNKFDAICTFEMIEHLKYPTKFLSIIHKVLNSNGVLFISTPNILVHSPHNNIESIYHVKEYTFREFKNLLVKFFTNVKIYGQGKSKYAKYAISKFMNSQEARQKVVEIDKLKLRKIIPDPLKEGVWRNLGAFWGRSYQNKLSFKDFPITSRNVSNSEYFIAICKK